MHSVCPHDCPSACSLEVTVVDGDRLTAVTGNRRPSVHPGRDLRQGARVRRARALAPADHRAAAPGRAQGRRRLRADRLGRGGRGDRPALARDSSPTHGAEAILPFSYAGSMGQVQYFAGHPLFHALGASRLDRTICIATAYAGWRATVGRRDRQRLRADGRRRPRGPVGHQRRLFDDQRHDAGQAGAGPRRPRGRHRSVPDADGAAGRRAPDGPPRYRCGAGPGHDARADRRGPRRPRLRRPGDARLRAAGRST